jgi:hypothetical protein
MLDGGIDCGRDDAEGACREECPWEPLATVEPIAVETTEKRGAVGSPIGGPWRPRRVVGSRPPDQMPVPRTQKPPSSGLGGILTVINAPDMK